MTADRSHVIVKSSSATKDEPCLNSAAISREKLAVICAMAFVLAVVALRLPGLEKSLFIDEVGSYHQATAPHALDTMRHDIHPPLYFILLRFFTYWTHDF